MRSTKQHKERRAIDRENGDSRERENEDKAWEAAYSRGLYHQSQHEECHCKSQFDIRFNTVRRMDFDGCLFIYLDDRLLVLRRLGRTRRGRPSQPRSESSMTEGISP